MLKLGAQKGDQKLAKGRKRKWRGEKVRPRPTFSHARATPDGVGGGLPALKGGDLHLGPLAAKVGPESSIRTLFVYWVHTLVH